MFTPALSLVNSAVVGAGAGALAGAVDASRLGRAKPDYVNIAKTAGIAGAVAGGLYYTFQQAQIQADMAGNPDHTKAVATFGGVVGLGYGYKKYGSTDLSLLVTSTLVGALGFGAVSWLWNYYNAQQ